MFLIISYASRKSTVDRSQITFPPNDHPSVDCENYLQVKKLKHICVWWLQPLHWCKSPSGSLISNRGDLLSLHNLIYMWFQTHQCPLTSHSFHEQVGIRRKSSHTGGGQDTENVLQYFPSLFHAIVYLLWTLKRTKCAQNKAYLPCFLTCYFMPSAVILFALACHSFCGLNIFDLHLHNLQSYAIRLLRQRYTFDIWVPPHSWICSGWIMIQLRKC